MVEAPSHETTVTSRAIKPLDDQIAGVKVIFDYGGEGQNLPQDSCT